MASHSALTPPITGDQGLFCPSFLAGPDGVVLAAPAKLNLFLEILGKRPDGYHALESLMLGVNLFDTLEIQRAGDGELHLTCEPAGLETGPTNLVWKAAAALRRQAGRPELGATFRLTKRIPTQAGLAGGSSDAAAALVGLNTVWRLGFTKAELAAVAATVGSDVAFFLDLPAAWCTGRGEIVQAEPVGRPLHFVLVCPAVGLGTADVYRRLQVSTAAVSGDAPRQALRTGDVEALGRALHNRLQEPAFALSPLVERWVRRLAEFRPAGCLMSGSGSAVFALVRDREEALRVADSLRADPLVSASRSTRVLVVQSLAHADAC